MKRWALRICVFLMLGAIVNVAVAWGCAASSRLRAGPVSTNAADWDWLRDEGWKPLADYGGYTVRNATQHFSGFGVEYLAYVESEDVREGQFGSFLLSSVSSAQSVRAGWPMRSLDGRAFDGIMTTRRDIRGTYMILRKSDSMPILLHASGTAVWIPYREIAGHEFGGRYAPLVPIWPAFAVNTVFYAAILWLLFVGPFALRRRLRIRRGLCPKCAYDLRGSIAQVCPECGAQK